MHIQKRPLQTTNWVGGTTSEWFIFPEESSYQERNFLIRISTATVDQSPSDFTKLPDFDRKLLMLSGEGVLNLNQATIHLSADKFIHFKGKDEVQSIGQFTDFNVIHHPTVHVETVSISLKGVQNITRKGCQLFLWLKSGSLTLDNILIESHQGVCLPDQNDLKISGEAEVILVYFVKNTLG